MLILCKNTVGENQVSGIKYQDIHKAIYRLPFNIAL